METYQSAKWDKMNDGDLKVAVRSALIGRGMYGAYDYTRFKAEVFDVIESSVRERICRVLLELVDEVDDRGSIVGGKALYVCSEIGSSEMISKIVSVIRIAGRYLDMIEECADFESCKGYVEFMADLNVVIGRGRFKEGRDLLIKEVEAFGALTPVPLSKEHFVWGMLLPTARHALRSVEGE